MSKTTHSPVSPALAGFVGFDAMKRTAIQACHTLAGWIFDSPEASRHLWRIADRIERRWHIQDATQTRLSELQTARAQFLRDECARHDRLNPDRLSYLHR